LIRHHCRHHKASLQIKKKYPIIVKKPKGLLEKQSLSCPVCGKLFKKAKSLEDHLGNLRKNDIYHKLFLENRISFEDKNREDIQKDRDQIEEYKKLEFGKINIKKAEKN
jgi:hypothetical protein